MLMCFLSFSVAEAQSAVSPLTPNASLLTPNFTLTSTPTFTPTPTRTFTPSPTPYPKPLTPRFTPTPVFTRTVTPTKTRTLTPAPTFSPTRTPTATLTVSPTPTSGVLRFDISPKSEDGMIRFKWESGLDADKVFLRIFTSGFRLVQDFSFDPRNGADELGAGSHEYTWDGKDDVKRSLPPGIYLCFIEVDVGRKRFEAGGQLEIR